MPNKAAKIIDILIVDNHIVLINFSLKNGMNHRIVQNMP